MLSRRMAIALLLLFAVGGSVTVAAEQRLTAFVGATVIDGTGSPPVPRSTILVRGDRIVAIGVGIPVPPEAAIIDCSWTWIVPGLIDAHVHFFQSAGLYARPDFIDLRAIRPYAREIADTRRDIGKTFARYIASGITAVIDMGGPLWTFDVRAEAARRLIAPRVAVAGPLLGTWAPPELTGIADPPILAIASPEAARAAVRRLLVRRPDLIKIWFVHPRGDLGHELAWVNAAIETAHAAGVPVIAHATQLRVARAVIAAGAKVLAHSVDDQPLDAETLAAMQARRAIYVPTLIVRRGSRGVLSRRLELSEIERRLGDPKAIASWSDLVRLPGSVIPDWIARQPVTAAPANLRRIQASGVTIAAGSDAGNIGTLHGPALHREIEAMVEAGLTPMQALVAATRGGAAAMGRGRDLGTLQPGKLADLVVLDADPLADIRNTRRIARIVKGGEIIDPRALAAQLTP
jgi:imidazolonepropionase-like amidohydrolase